MAPFHAVDGRIRVRWPLTGLAGAEPVPGSVAFVAVMLGSVLFDGYSRTTTWQDLLGADRGPVPRRPAGARASCSSRSLNLGGLLAGVAARRARLPSPPARSPRWSVDAPRSLAPEFVLSLVPIAFAYMVAHYFSLFVIQGQFAIPLLSDPLGKGWDLFGTAGCRSRTYGRSRRTRSGTSRSARSSPATWPGSRSPTIARSTIFQERGDALRSQYAMLALMVLYTVGGLWVLSRG